ncbi:MAG: hypothetical protein U1F43_28650 [Myxococcota bacterium]
MNAHPTLEAVRHALLAVHKELVEVARADYAREHGAMPTPQVLLHHLTTDEAYAWLRPLSMFIAQADELLDDDEDGAHEAALALKKELELAMKAEPFTARYRPALQDRPDLIMAHSELVRALNALR